MVFGPKNSIVWVLGRLGIQTLGQILSKPKVRESIIATMTAWVIPPPSNCPLGGLLTPIAHCGNSYCKGNDPNDGNENSRGERACVCGFEGIARKVESRRLDEPLGVVSHPTPRH